MHTIHRRLKGYSRLEIAFILVIVLFVGLLAVTKYLDTSLDVEEAMEPGLIEGVRAGLAAYAEESMDRGNTTLFPHVLDQADPGAATPSNRFFGNVLERGVAVPGWSKLKRNQYRTPSGKRVIYEPQTGEFQLQGENTAINQQ